MNINNKQAFIQTIFNACERCFIAPENPFTLDNPDLVCANGNKLFAFYIPTYSESLNYDHLLRRLYLSQLSYGYALIPILMLLEESSMRMLNNPVIAKSFNHISASIDDSLRFIQQADLRYRRMKFFSEIQTKQFLTYRQYLQLSEEVHKEVRSVFSAGEMMRQDLVAASSWSTQKRKESKSYHSVPGGYIATVEKKKKESFRTAFEYLMTLAFMSKFNYDEGSLYPTGMNAELSVMNTDWDMFDNEDIPNSYNHMLSFIGLPPVSITPERDFEQVFERYQNIRNHGIG